MMDFNAAFPVAVIIQVPGWRQELPYLQQIEAATVNYEWVSCQPQIGLPFMATPFQRFVHWIEYG
jgi:hypothetical protein